MSLIAAWLRAFALTTCVEGVVAFPLLGRDQARMRRIGAILFAQLASHPLVWFVWPELRMTRWLYLVVVESWAVAIELLLYWLVFKNLGPRRALLVALLANAASFSVGLLLH